MFFSVDTPSFFGPRHCGQDSPRTTGETININVNESRVRRMGVRWVFKWWVLRGMQAESQSESLGTHAVHTQE